MVVIVAVVAGILLINQNPRQYPQVVHVSAIRASSIKTDKDPFLLKEIVVMIGINNTATSTNDDIVVHTVHSDIPEFD